MRARHALQAFVGLSAVSALLIGTAVTDSYAATTGGRVTWTNKATGKCLRHNIYISLGDVNTGGCSANENQWIDMDYPDGTWAETPWGMLGNVNPSGECLTAYWNNSVYIEGCNSASPNSYEKWWEISTSTGWKLQNVATNLILDSNSAGSVYAIGNNDGNNQRWS